MMDMCAVSIRRTSSFILLFSLLFCVTITIACVTTPANSCQRDCCINESAAAIGIALTDPEVGTYLGDGPYSIIEVKNNETAKISLGYGREEVYAVSRIKIDTPDSVVHIDVDVPNCTVLFIWPQYKRFIPAPSETIFMK
jgi:hypothetical protein